MEFIDLKAQQDKIRTQLDQAVQTVFDHGQYIMGPEVRQLENRLAAYVGVKHAIGCSSGTDALLLALMALNVGPGDAIFTSPFTFIATAEVISLLGATPIFVDIDPDTFNLNPSELETAIEKATIGRPDLKPAGIIAVDIFGLPADYDRIEKIARAKGLFIVEDAAQSLGSEISGKKAGAFGDIACTSFFPAKPLGCYGDGGMCFTNDDNYAEIINSLRIHGKGSHKYDNTRIGINGRLDTLQAAILCAKLDIFPEEMERRQQVAVAYGRRLIKDRRLKVQEIPPSFKSAWAQYSILAESEAHRAEIQHNLKANGIPSAIYYPLPLHLQKAFRGLGYGPGDFPVSEDCSKRIFSIPMHPYLGVAEQERIADIITS